MRCFPASGHNKRRWARPRRAACLFAGAFLVLATAARAQGEAPLRPGTRGELWLSATGSCKPFDKKNGKHEKEALLENLEFLGELGWKTRTDPFGNKYWYTTAGTKLRLTDFLKVGAEYRHSWKDRYSPNVPRLGLQLWLSWDKDRISLDHRFTYQHEFIPVDKLRTVLRNRLGVEYNIPHWKLDPHVSAEAFTGLHYTGNTLAGMRYELGTELELDKKGRRTIDLAVRFDQELHTANPENRWIFVVGYGHEFKKK